MPESIFHRLRTRGLRLASNLGWLPPAVTRLSLGVVFVGTGWGKLHNLDKVTAFFGELGIPAPGCNATLAASAELVCGALLLVGLLSRLAALPLAFTMAVAIATAKRADLNGISDLFGFEEWLLLVLAVWIAVAGPGPLSLDALIGRLRPAPGSRPVSAGVSSP